MKYDDWQKFYKISNILWFMIAIYNCYIQQTHFSDHKYKQLLSLANLLERVIQPFYNIWLVPTEQV